MNTLSHDQIRTIVSKMDPVSKARFMATSKEFRNIVKSMSPPTGSYEDRTGRFQNIYSMESYDDCVSLIHNDVEKESGIVFDTEFSILDQGGEGFAYMQLLKHPYENNHLFTSFRNTFKKHDQKVLIRHVREVFPDMSSNNNLNEINEYAHHVQLVHSQYRRRILRLLKAFAKENPVYKETLALLRRRSKPYTTREEKDHKDRLMDAILIIALVFLSSDDPTKERYTQNGKKMTLNEKISRLIKRCIKNNKNNK